MVFNDHFSKKSDDYAKFRPRYPTELFKYLAGVVPGHRLAWDCATGNGQAALELANFFERVIATDASEKQIASATPNDRVRYRVATAEDSGLDSASADLVTVAQALHWFDLEKFYGEVRRVLKPNGVLAIWTYNLLQMSPEIDALIDNFYRETVGPYWDFERTLVESGYRTLPFPFPELKVPEFQMKAEWSLNHLVGYLRTWSATKSFIKERGFDPVTELATKLAALWGDVATRKIATWPLSVRAGRIE